MFLALIQKWIHKKDGVALMETAMLYPTLLVMIFGVYDVGHAITVNHKMITASQMMADLITRQKAVSAAEINEAVESARLAMIPYASGVDDFGVDIISVEFDEDDDPVQLWRETRNMAAQGNLLERTTGLGTVGEGVVAVTVTYRYRPTFGYVLINEYLMSETAFARGRKSATVTQE